MATKIKFTIRCSAIHEIMGGKIGLTETQQKDYDTWKQRAIDFKNGVPKVKDLTDIQKKALKALQLKIDKPELPQGAKSYCKKWLNEYLWKRRQEIKSKYIDKGNQTQEDGFTLTCIQLNLGFIKENTERKFNDFMNGICDIDHEKLDTVFDNKSSWDLSTFPMYEDEIPDKKYLDQGQGYMELWDRSKACIVYTLIDCPEDILLRQFPYYSDHNQKQKIALNLIFTLEYWELMKAKYFPDADEVEFVEIPEKSRVKPFYFERDREFIKEVEERVKLCNEYVNNELLPKINK